MNYVLISDGNFFNAYTVHIHCIVTSLIIGTLIMIVPLFVYINAIIFSAMILLFSLDIMFSGHLHYAVKHMFRALFNDSFSQVISAPIFETHEVIVLVIFIAITSLCMYLRTKFREEDNYMYLNCCKFLKVNDLFSNLDFSTWDDDINASNQTIITRWTDGDDDVFESPDSNYRFFRQLSIKMRQYVP